MSLADVPRAMLAYRLPLSDLPRDAAERLAALVNAGAFAPGALVSIEWSDKTRMDVDLVLTPRARDAPTKAV